MRHFREKNIKVLLTVLFFLQSLISCENPQEATELPSLIEGKVTNKNGQPISGVKVGVFEKSVYTDANGNYRIVDVKAGQQTVKFTKQFYDTKKIQVFFGFGSKITRNVRLEKFGTLNGQIFDKNNNPIDAVKITVIPGNKTVYSCSNGYYEIFNLPEGEYILKLDKSEFLKKSIKVFVKNDTITTQNIYLTEYGGIKGIVSGLNPVYNVKVTLNPSGDIAYTNSNGFYKFFPLVAGEYKLSFEKTNFIPETTMVTVTNDNITEKNVTLDQFGYLGGSVRKSNGEGLGNVRITLLPNNVETYTSEGGYYSFGYLDKGSYELIFEKEFYITQTAEVNVQYNVYHYIDIKLKKRGTIMGIVKMENGEPVEGVKVTTTPNTIETYTDNSGYYEIPNLEQRAYLVKIEKENLPILGSKAYVFLDGITQKDFTFYDSEEYFTMVDITGGTFEMGSDYFEDELPIHTVTLNDFKLGKYEITNFDFIRFLNSIEVNEDGSYNGIKYVCIGENDCSIAFYKGMFYFKESNYAVDQNAPVVNVTWYGAIAFCNWLSEQNGLSKFYNINGSNVTFNWNASGYRLPTEAEWEFAAGGGNMGHGFLYSGSNDFHDVAWCKNSYIRTIQPVGLKQPNELGLYDMSGNAWEWCNDWYDANYYSVSPENNPTGPENGNFRVKRGGSFEDFPSQCRVTNRSYYAPSNSTNFIYTGFRICR